jgi:2-polyprenyl-3-methyl-5-hydroxy-6-metoxy-1,4-benzoquinol methylase
VNLESQISNQKYPPCDLCGAVESADLVLMTPRLDGPLVRCRDCGLFYVVFAENKEDKPSVVAEMARLAERAGELELVDPDVEASERPWRELTARERLGDLKRFGAEGRLLEIGCSTGELLDAARSSFTVAGVEADERTSRAARMRGLEVFNGALCDAGFPEGHFDVAAMYHVIEHVPSPRREVRELRRIIKPGGWLILETPNISTVWYRLLGARWRQFIPDHIFFFTPQTLTRLCENGGFEVRELRSVGKAMSLRLFINRLGRYQRRPAKLLEAVSDHLNLSDLTIRLKLGDVMRLYARRI